LSSSVAPCAAAVLVARFRHPPPAKSQYAAPKAHQIAFMQWIFSAMSLHPAGSPLASITAEQRVAFDKKAAALFIRLMSADCRQQTIDALKYEGAAALQASFQLLGQVAMRGLMSDANVAEGLKQLGTYTEHDENWISVLRDAGISPKSPGKQ